MKTTLIITALMIALAAVKTCKGADWSMGTPDARYPMDGGSTQTTNQRANGEYEIAHHMIAVGFTNDEVLRAWGKEDEITGRSVSDRGALEAWRYRNPDALVWLNNGIVSSMIQ